MTATLSPLAAPLVRIRPAPAWDPPVDGARPPDEPVCRGQLALFASIHGVPRDPTVPRPRLPAGVSAAAPPDAAPVGSAGVPRTAAHPGAPAGASSAAGMPGTAAHPAARPATHPAARPATHPAAGSADPAVGPADPTVGPADPASGPAHAAPAPAGGPSPSAQAHVAAGRFVAACVEVLNGFRPATHLRALTTPVDYPDVMAQITRRAARIRIPARGAGRQSVAQVGVRRVRVCELPAGVVEAAAVLHRGDASWAMALRFERRRDTWLCTLLQML
jgi:hypothetical protein